jgi:hypothetical protein
MHDEYIEVYLSGDEIQVAITFQVDRQPTWWRGRTKEIALRIRKRKTVLMNVSAWMLCKDATAYGDDNSTPHHRYPIEKKDIDKLYWRRTKKQVSQIGVSRPLRTVDPTSVENGRPNIYGWQNHGVALAHCTEIFSQVAGRGLGHEHRDWETNIHPLYDRACAMLQNIMCKLFPRPWSFTIAVKNEKKNEAKRVVRLGNACQQSDRSNDARKCKLICKYNFKKRIKISEGGWDSWKSV